MNFRKKNIGKNKRQENIPLETKYSQRKYSRNKKGTSGIVKFITYTIAFFFIS
jgi:hypothetical protein